MTAPPPNHQTLPDGCHELQVLGVTWDGNISALSSVTLRLQSAACQIDHVYRLDQPDALGPFLADMKILGCDVHTWGSRRGQIPVLVGVSRAAGQLTGVRFQARQEGDVLRFLFATKPDRPAAGQQPQQPRQSTVTGNGRPAAEARAVEYLATCDSAISGQGGHNKTMWAARAVIWGFDLDANTGYRILETHYNPRCVPPWSETELRHKAAEADKGPYDKVRGWLRNEERQHKGNSGATGPPPPAPPQPPPPPPPQAGAVARRGVEIIVDYFRESYDPDFKRGNAIHCADGREVSMLEACSVPTSDLIERLASASDAPCFAESSAVKRQALPGFFGKWARVAWGDLLSVLPDEDNADLGADSCAAEDFRRMVRDAMLSQVTFAEVMREIGDSPHPERRSLIDWCKRFARAGPWRDVRSLRCWCRERMKEEGLLVLEVAIRVELFPQIKADPRLCKMKANTFSRRAERYGVGSSSREERPHGESAVMLHAAFLADLVASLGDDVEGGEAGEGR